MTKNDIKKAEAVMDSWKTEDLNKIRLSAGKLTPEGVVFKANRIEDSEGKHGVFWVVSGINEEAKEVELTFSSQKLHQIFADHWADMEGKFIHVCGNGSGFDREYKVKLV